MTSRPQRLKPIGFWSYARQDDEASDGRLSQLRGQLARELQQVYGRQKIQLWQDVAAIPPGAEWDKAIDEAIAQSTFLIPIITPAFVESEFCCREVAKFFEREKEINAAHPELAGQRRIFPIVYIDTQDCDPYDPAIVAQLNELQFVDFRVLREDDDPQQIRRAVVRLAGEIARLLKIKVAPPPSPEELEKQRLAREAEERAKAERKRKEEEERKRREQEEREEADRALQLKIAERVQMEKAAALEAERLSQKKREKRERREKEAQEKAKRRKEQRDKWLEPIKSNPLVSAATAFTVFVPLALLVSGAFYDEQPRVGAGEMIARDGLDTTPAREQLNGITPSQWSSAGMEDIAQQVFNKADPTEVYRLAEDGHVKAQTLIAWQSLIGDGLPELNLSQEEALRLNYGAADGMFARAQFNLGWMYRNGQGGLAVDKAAAARLYRFAADQGNARAQNDLGFMYFKGEGGLKVDKAEAVRLYRLAAEQGHPSAQFNLGWMYKNGQGGLAVKKSEAARLFRLAADHGNASAQNDLGVMYFNGEGGLAVDKTEAVRLYRLAAEQGSEKARKNLLRLGAAP